MSLCPECKMPMHRICYECGCFYDEPEFVVNDLYNYRQKPKRIYNRLDHFKEVLRQFQGSEGRDVPIEIINKIKNEITTTDITIFDIKKTLRILKLSKYIENCNYLLFSVTGEQPPYIPRLIEEKVIRTFKQIDRAYNNIYKDDRRSFLNYYYVLYKILELMKQDEILKRIPMIKTKLRLAHHDQIWELICNDLGWTYKKTIEIKPKRTI